MKVESKEVEYCKLNVFYEADTEDVEAKIDEAIAELRKVQIPGFRSYMKKDKDGKLQKYTKAPDYAIKARCRKQIKDWVVKQMWTQAFDDIVFETGIKPIGHPSFEEITFKLNDNKFACKINMMKAPEFELGQYSEFELDKPDVNDDLDRQINDAIESFRIRFGSQRMFDENETLQKGDQITMSFTATIDGNTFDGGVSEGELYVVGQNRFTGFDEKILGMKVEEEREFDLVMPEEIPDIGGKTVNFKVTILMASRLDLAEKNEEFYKTLGVENEEQLVEQLKNVISVQIANAKTNDINNQVARKLVDNHQFKVPEFFVDGEARLLVQKGVKYDRLDEKVKEQLRDLATEKVRLSLILDAIRDNEPDSVLSDNEAQQKVLARIQAQGGDINKFLVEAQRNGQLVGMLTAVRDEFTLQWIVNSCKVKEN